MYQTETPIRKIPNLFSGRRSISQSLCCSVVGIGTDS
jgi:hypothetical protein